MNDKKRTWRSFDILGRSRIWQGRSNEIGPRSSDYCLQMHYWKEQDKVASGSLENVALDRPLETPTSQTRTLQRRLHDGSN